MSARSDIQTAMAALARQEVTAVSVAVRVSDYGLALTAEWLESAADAREVVATWLAL